MTDPFSTMEAASQALRITKLEAENRRLRELCGELADRLDEFVRYGSAKPGSDMDVDARTSLDRYRKEMK